MSQTNKENHSEWVETNKTLHAECKIFNVIEKSFSKNNKEGKFYTLDSNDWTLVLAMTHNKELVLVEQYRFGTASKHWELPGGIIDKDESPANAAIRELAEETGYEGSQAHKIGWSHPNPAFLNNKAHFILIKDCELKHLPKWDEHEEIHIKLVPIAEAFKMIKSGKITHGVTLNALMFLQYYLHT